MNPIDELSPLLKKLKLSGLLISMDLRSQQAVEEWYPLFNNPLLASAAMDRLLHHVHIIELEGQSYRTSKKPKHPSKK